MFVWVYGLTFSLSFYFLAEDEPLAVQLTPLFLTALLSFFLALRHLREEKNASLHIASLCTNVLLMFLFWVKTDDMYYIFTAVFSVICIMYVVANANTFFQSPPKWLIVANFISMVTSTVLFILFYAAVKNHAPNHVIYIPLTVLLLVEASVLVRLRTMADLVPEKIMQLQNERIAYGITVLVVMGTSIAYTSDAISLSVNALICTIVYGIGLLWMCSPIIAEVLCRRNGYRNMHDLNGP